MQFGGRYSESKRVEDQVEWTREQNGCEANARTKLFIRFAEGFSQHHESNDDRDRHGSENQISHLVLRGRCHPRWTKAHPEKSQKRKWRGQKNSGQREQSRFPRCRRDRAGAKSPCR